MKVNAILAISDNDIIGVGGKLPWGRQSEDMKRFKKITQGRVIIMGRKTWESLPKKLPGRVHIVLTRKPGRFVDVVTAHSLDEALSQAKELSNATPVIIGGADLYDQVLSQDLVENLYLTRIHVNVPPSEDTVMSKVWKYLDNFQMEAPKSPERQLADQENENDYTFFDLVRKRSSGVREEPSTEQCPECGGMDDKHADDCPEVVYGRYLQDRQALMQRAEKKFQKNQFKEHPIANPGGVGCRDPERLNIPDLFQWAEDELKEIRSEYEAGNLEEALNECGDVVNMVTFITGKIRRLAE